MHQLATASPVDAAAARDIAARVGLFQVTVTWSANVADYDRNGYPDLLLVRHHDAATPLFRNTGSGTFVVASAFPRADRHDCAWGDANVDGAPDAYCTVGAQHGTGERDKELWIQQPNQTFVNQAAAWGITDPAARGRFATFLDANRDARPDLYVGAAPRPDGVYAPNRLWLNQGASFNNAPSYGVDTAAGNFCAEAVDFDGDGWEDLAVCGASRFFLYRNVSGTQFSDATASVGVSTAKLQSVRFSDLNRDGKLDLVLVSAAALRVQLQNASGTFAAPVTVAAMSGSWDTATGDFDGDGDQDIYLLTTGTTRDRIYLNTGNGVSYAALYVPPPAVVGSGDTVEALNYNADSRTEFVVLNGRGETRGGVQLIAWE